MLDRLLRWAGLFLAWVIPYATSAAHAFRATRWLEASLAITARRMAALVGNVLLIEAMLACVARHHRFRGQFHGRQRALIGAALRRLLCAGSPLACLQRLAAILQNRAEIIARLVARIERGLTHVHRAPARTDTPALPLFTLSLAAADSS